MVNLDCKKLVRAGFFGNLFEWYDFAIYAYFAVTLGQVFFPSGDKRIELLKAFLLFSASYLIRPIGSFFFGYLADKVDRNRAFRTALVLMAIPTALISLLPSYHSAGVMATFCLVLLRLLQGFAAGGELPISACYLYENARDEKKTFYCSFAAASSMMGVLAGSITAALIHLVLSEQALLNWGWRIPFAIGFVLLIVIYWIRKDISLAACAESEPVRDAANTRPRRVSLAFFQVISINAFISVAFYLLFVWMPAYLHVYLHITSSRAFISNIIGLSVLIAGTLLFGYFAHTIGRRTCALISVISIFCLAYPLFSFLGSQFFVVIIGVQILFAFALSFIDAINMELITSRFDRHFRGRGAGLGFTLSTAIFGGTAPTICTYIINQTGMTLSPVIFLMVMCVAAVPAILTLAQR